MDILLVGTYTQHDAPAVLEKQELGKGIYLIPYNEILGDVAGTPLIIQMQNPSWDVSYTHLCHELPHLL